MKNIRSMNSLLWIMLAALSLAGGMAHAQTPGVAAGDFNGDGIDDLAIPVPNQDVSGATDAGAVIIMYGTASGLSADGNKLFHQNKNGVASEAQTLERFATTLAVGNFNGDAYDDLAIGVPNQSFNAIGNAGAVHVMFGTANGLKPAGSQYWTQESTNVANKCKADDLFGTGLGAGDFDGDGFDDLAIGAPGEKDKASGSIHAGGVNVLYGSASGLNASGNQFWSLGTTGIPEDPANDDNFGFAITTGDFNGDGFVDMAVDAPGKTISTFAAAGSVTLIYGTAAGLDAAGAQTWNQDSTGIDDAAEANDGFGASLAAGDFNDDGFADLVCGAADETIGATASCGAAHIIYGSAAGLDAAGTQMWTQDSSTVLDAAESGDAFGASLAAGDFNDDGFEDLAIGAPGENIAGGAINMLLGSALGLTDTGNKFFSKTTIGMLGDADSIAGFAYTVCAGQFDSDDRCDLAVGIPFQDINGTASAGAVQILYGNANGTGLGVTNNQFWSKASDGISGDPAMNELFGGL
jgi:hypothetical protein